MPVASDLTFLTNGVDLACAFNSFTPQTAINKLDSTVLCETARSYEMGFISSTLSFGGFYKYSAVLEKLVEDTLRNALLNNTQLIITTSPEPFAIGGFVYLLNAKSYASNINVVVDAIISTSGNFESDNGLRPGKLLFNAQVNNTTTNGTVNNNGAATARGGLFHAHNQNTSANGITVILQHSTSGVGSWVNLATLTFGSVSTGTYTLVANPADASTIVFNGITFTFLDTPSAPTDVQRGTGATGSDTDLGISIDNLVTALNASANAALTGATYSDNHTSTNKNATKIFVTFDTYGTGGNSYTLGTNTGNVVRSAATLTGGTAAATGAQSFDIPDGTTVRRYTRTVVTTDGDATIQTALSRI